jgi:predicted dehydrogenase
MVKASLIGISGFGDVHYRQCIQEVERGRLSLSSAVVINQQEEPLKCEKLKSLGCRIFDNIQTMLADDASRGELCIIPTGIPLHRPMSESALRAGCHVYVEKPAAPTVQDVQSMMAVEQSTGRFVSVGFQSMHSEDMLWMKRQILQGRLGKIHSLSCVGLWPRGRRYYTRNRWAGRLKDHRGDWVLDSPANNAMAHQLNALCFLAGSELYESANIATVQAELYRSHPIESADTMSMRMTTETGLRLLFLASHCPEGTQDPGLEIRGSEGVIRWTYHVGAELSLRNGTRENCPFHPKIYDKVYDDLLMKVQQRHHFVCPLSVALAQTLCVNAAHESSPVHSIPSQFFKSVVDGDDEHVVINGIDQILRQCQKEEKLPSELGVVWATPAPVFNCATYRHFSGTCAL